MYHKSFHNKTVLILDDDLDFLSMVSKILKNAGLKVIPALDIYSAIINVEKRLPHLIICDFHLSNNETAKDFLVKFRKLDKINKIPLIICTSSTESLEEFLDLNILDIVRKPFRQIDLLSSIKTILMNIPEMTLDVDRTIQSSINCELKAISENSTLVYSPVKFTERTQISLKSNSLKESNIDIKGMYTNTKSTFIKPGIYASTLEIQGITESLKDSINKMVIKWKKK